ncbi:MAG: MOSC domain-containing protein [Frankia sp.]
MPGRVSSLYRYPVKGMSPEPLSSIALTEGDGVPMDRVYALARPDTVFDPERPAPLPKQRFVMLMKDEALAAVRSRYDDTTGLLSLTHGDRHVETDLTTPGGRRVLEDLVAAVVGPGLGGRPRVVTSAGYRFTDVAVTSPEMMNAVSLINLASVADLERRSGARLDPLRFRANIYLDGVPAWSELDWVGRTVTVGSGADAVRLHVAARTGRCAATSVDPATAVRDVNVPRALQNAYGHMKCGVYAFVRSSGTIRVGDAARAGGS